MDRWRWLGEHSGVPPLSPCAQARRSPRTRRPPWTRRGGLRHAPRASALARRSGSARVALPLSPPRVVRAAPGAGRHHRRSSRMDGRDDLLDVNALEVDRGRPQVGVTELSLDDVQRHALAGELKRMRLTELVWREPAPHPRSGSEAAELDPNSGRRPGPPACRPVDHAEQRADGQPLALDEPGAELLEAPLVHAHLAAAAALATADEDGATAPVEVTLGERERLLDAKPAAPKDDDQGVQPSAVAISANLAHHGDDLLDRRRVGRVAYPLVAGRSSGVVAGHRRWRAAAPGGVENSGYGHGILLPRDNGYRAALPAGTSDQNENGEASYGIGRIASRTSGASCWGVVPALKLRIQSARSGSDASTRWSLSSRNVSITTSARRLLASMNA